ncbi:MAG: pyruvate dehydrogenase (acetyl-transferring) E1 component subunit alpha, partial [Rhizobiaceae bacterium]|nr:pyruvate dehydrogenase (acetyl-transferring) E1 component subunit alpha [Rhizobiaceae bacterium]
MIPQTALKSVPATAVANLPDIYRRLSIAELSEALRKMHLIRRFEEGA